MTNICVLGAGVIGLTTAWELAERGFQVSIVDRQPEPGVGTSFANGAQLSYSYVAPLASPDTLRKLPRMLLTRHGPIRVRLTHDPDFIRWGAAFVAASTEAMVQETTLAQLALAELSRGVLTDLAARQGLSFGLRPAGKLVVYRTKAAFDSACRQAVLQARLGGSGQRILSPTECLQAAPALRLGLADLAGGVYSADDEVGDCLAFCRELATRLRQRSNVTWHLGTHARGFVMAGDAIQAVDTSQGQIEAGLVVLALGAEAPRFARRAGFRLPIWPMKGYSITAAPLPGTPPLDLSITDFDRKVVYAPLRANGTDVVRVAGIADLVGFDYTIDQGRLATLVRHAADTLRLDLESEVRPWAGLRPVTPDSRPIIGWSPICNLFLNTGHGGLGWTLACGSARLAAELITDAAPSVRPESFALARTPARHERLARLTAAPPKADWT